MENTTIENALFKITRDFVPDVKIKMIVNYFNLNEDVRKMADTLLLKYLQESVQKDDEEKRLFSSFITTIKADKDNENLAHYSLNASCLNHARHYQEVIIDILQEKL